MTESKFKIGDEVYKIHDNTIYKQTILEIKNTYRTDFICLLESWLGWVSQEDIFTKQELLKMIEEL